MTSQLLFIAQTQISTLEAIGAWLAWCVPIFLVVGIALTAWEDWLNKDKEHTTPTMRFIKRSGYVLLVADLLLVFASTWINAEIGNAKDHQLHKMEQSIADLQPKPLSVRLKVLLESIDARILPALEQGMTKFGGGITSVQLYELQKIVEEEGAEQFISLDPQVTTGLGTGPGGSNSHGVNFSINPLLLDEP